jgi:hypothetical protein
MLKRRTWWLAGAALLAALSLAPTYVGVDTNSVQTLSNKILDRTNTIQTFGNLQLWGAQCSNVTPLALWDIPTSNAPSAACLTGSNTQKATLDFSSSTAQSAQYTIQVPQGYNIAHSTSVEILWSSVSTSGSVVWQVATACAANNATATDDPSFNTANTVTSAAPGTASRIQSASISALTMTGCATGYTLHLKLSRTPGSGADTMASNPARFMMLRLRIPREG